MGRLKIVVSGNDSVSTLCFCKSRSSRNDSCQQVQPRVAMVKVQSKV